MGEASGLMLVEQVLSAACEPMNRVSRAAGLTHSTWPLVWWLRRAQRLSGTALAERTCRRRQDVQRSLEWLMERGLVRREGEGRYVQWSLTAEAKPALKVLDQYEVFFHGLFKLEFRDEWPRLLHLMERARDLLRTGIPSPHAVTPGFVPRPIADSYLWDP